MNEGEGTEIPDTTQLRQAIAPGLRERLDRILRHTRRVREWAAQHPALTDAERAAMLAQLDGVEQTVHALDAGAGTDTP